MRFSYILLIALIVLVSSVPSIPAFAADAASSDPVFDRVMSTRTLRCGYTVYPPFFEKDLKTGEFKGMFYDFTQEIAKRLNIKVEYVAEVGYDMLFEGFKSGRYDAVCGGYANVPARANGGDFTKPIVYIPTYVFVRNDETRFKTYDDLNKPIYTVATIDGEFSQIIARQMIPNAKEFSMQGLTTAAERMEMIASKKADFSPFEAAIGFEYIRKNPGKIRKFGDKPLHVFGTSIIVPHKENALKNYLDNVIDNMTYDGTIDRVIAKHIPDKGAAFPPAVPYKE